MKDDDLFEGPQTVDIVIAIVGYTMLFLGVLCVLQGCAVPAQASSAPASLPAGCLDFQGQRELIAGIELETGAQAAELARCGVQRRAAVKYADMQSERADAAEARLQWALPLGTVGGFAVGVGVTAGVEATIKHPASSK